MSVLVLDPKTIDYIRKGLVFTAYNREVNVHWSGTIHSHFRDKDVEAEADRLMSSLYLLNQRSYSAAYREEDKDHDLWKFVRKTMGIPCPFQLVKYIQCLLYNIEIDTINSKYETKVSDQELADHKMIEMWEHQILTAIVGMNNKYKDAKWSEPV